MADHLTIHLTSETMAALEQFKKTQAALYSSVGGEAFDEADQQNSMAAVEAVQHVWNDIYRTAQAPRPQSSSKASLFSLFKQGFRTLVGGNLR